MSGLPLENAGDRVWEGKNCGWEGVNFWSIRNLNYLCTPQKQGSLAQLVQSICLTSRGSGVRTPQLPLTNKPLRLISKWFFIGFQW